MRRPVNAGRRVVSGFDMKDVVHFCGKAGIQWFVGNAGVFIELPSGGGVFQIVQSAVGGLHRQVAAQPHTVGQTAVRVGFTQIDLFPVVGTVADGGGASPRYPAGQ